MSIKIIRPLLHSHNWSIYGKKDVCTTTFLHWSPCKSWTPPPSDDQEGRVNPSGKLKKPILLEWSTQTSLTLECLHHSLLRHTWEKNDKSSIIWDLFKLSIGLFPGPISNYRSMKNIPIMQNETVFAYKLLRFVNSELLCFFMFAILKFPT